MAKLNYPGPNLKKNILIKKNKNTCIRHYTCICLQLTLLFNSFLRVFTYSYSDYDGK